MYYENIYEHIAPQGFLEKPIQYNILNFFIKQAESEYKKKTAKLKISYDFKEHLIPIDSILYIQSSKRVCEIITDDKIYRCYKKLSDFPKGLARIFRKVPPELYCKCQIHCLLSIRAIYFDNRSYYSDKRLLR